MATVLFVLRKNVRHLLTTLARNTTVFVKFSRYNWLLWIGVAIVGSTSSCSESYRSYFGNGYRSLEHSYADMPHYDSVPKAAWQVSARYVRATGYNLSRSSDRSGDQNRAYEAFVFRGQTHRHVAWTAGLLSYYGRYRLGNRHDSVLVDHYFKNKSYFGLGSRGSVALNIPLANISFRPVGLDLIVNRELGQYPAFMQQFQGQSPLVTTLYDPWRVSIAFTSGLRAQVSDRVVLGYQAVVAIPERHYAFIYRKSGAIEEDQTTTEGVAATAFVGLDRTLVSLQFGIGPQFHLAGGVSYRFR